MGWNLAMQENVDDSQLSRAYSYDALGSYVAMPLGQLVYGPLGDRFGYAPVVAWSGVAYVAVALSPCSPGRCARCPGPGGRHCPRLTERRRAPAPDGAGALRWCRASPASGHLLILVTRPAPTVRPPSRMANCRPSSMAMGWMSSTAISVLSPGMTISVPSGRCTTPVTSVVRK